MHYRDGTEAKLGDIVRGRGYNLPYDVQGVVAGINPGQQGCSIHIIAVQPHVPLGSVRTPFVPTLTEEHGTCEAFELVHRDPALARQERP